MTTAVVTTLGVVPAADAATVIGAATGRPSGGPARTVTLVTGDRVTMLDGGAVSVEPGAGRSGVRFMNRQVSGHLRVIPSDAIGLLGAGRLDPRLFDVTTLLEYGYDDQRAELPLMVTVAKPDAGRVKAAATSLGAAGAKVTRQLPRAGVVAVKQDRSRAAGVWQRLTGGSGRKFAALGADVSKVWLDGLRRTSLDESVPQIQAPLAWQDGYTGDGVTVAVLDTGVDDTHPDLAGRVVARNNFTEGSEDARDFSGHGTHVASTIAGSGAASGGQYRGVAPDARLLDGKVCIEVGCAESWILAGMEWAAAEQHAKVVNMSLGGPDFAEIDPLEQAVNTLTAQYGTLFVIAAGNQGTQGASTVNSPGSAEAALTVGAVDKSDKLAAFSSRGPRVGDGGLKPDITAPGVAITAARGKDAEGVPGTLGDKYVALDGTSMATPHVAGAAAILAERRPGWTGGVPMTFVKETPAGRFGDHDGRGELGGERGIRLEEGAVYPLARPGRGGDARFTYGLALEVGVVLARYGYPQVRAGADLVRVQQALFGLIYGCAD